MIISMHIVSAAETLNMEVWRGPRMGDTETESCAGESGNDKPSQAVVYATGGGDWLI
jgi:hypothetical protein